MTLRRAESPEDLAACIALRKAVFMGEQGVPLEEELDGKDEGALHVLIGPSEAPQAVARIRILGHAAKIERVCVAEHARGTGIGAQLMQGIHTLLAPDPQVTLFKLEAQTHALRFYQKLGYAAEGDEFLDAGIPHYLMTRPA